MARKVTMPVLSSTLTSANWNVPVSPYSLPSSSSRRTAA